MIVHFYRINHGDTRHKKLIASKNITFVPQRGCAVEMSGQKFVVDKVSFDLDICEYSVYIVRA